MKILIGIGVVMLILGIAYLLLPDSARPKGFSRDKAQTTTVTTLTPTQQLGRCIIWASNSYQIPADVLFGIIAVEGGSAGKEAGPNTDGTYDLGLMQINSLWAPQLAQLWGVDYHTAYTALKDSSCTNVFVGAWVLRQGVVHTGSLYSGVAFYHTGVPGKGTAYADKVVEKMAQMGLTFPP
jgi:soluble lytic murein transglycosylase-like protein